MFVFSVSVAAAQRVQGMRKPLGMPATSTARPAFGRGWLTTIFAQPGQHSRLANILLLGAGDYSQLFGEEFGAQRFSRTRCDGQNHTIFV